LGRYLRDRCPLTLHFPRPYRRDRPRPRGHQPARPSVPHGPDGGDSRYGSGARAAEPDRWRHAAAERDPARLRLQPALPARLRALHRRAPGPSACRRNPRGLLAARHPGGSRGMSANASEVLGAAGQGAKAHDVTSMRATAPLVQARDLAKVFDVSVPWLNRVIERRPRQLLHAVDGVSFDIQKCKTRALVGESGGGKSTVARLLVGLYEPTRGGLTFDGQDAHAAFKTPQGRQLRRRIQMIFQDPYASLNPRWIVEDIVGEPLKEHRIITDRAELKERVGELLKSVGLSPLDMVKYPHQFSGGQRQRISIRRAPAAEPEV